jgi:NitT/TauT family transport system ATP-binding protein
METDVARTPAVADRPPIPAAPAAAAVDPRVPPPLAEFDRVAKAFGEGASQLEAVRDIRLTVSEGDFVTLVGPSGCGKSTLLNMLAGLFAPTEGVVRYRGRVVSGINRRVGYMTQQDHLLPWRDVAGNVAVPLEIRGIARGDRRATVQRLIDLVGLTGFERAYPSQLSGGMRKRCSFARLLACDAETLLMDEPFGSLDAQLRLTLQGEVLRICRQLGKTVLFVTHDLDEAVALADRCVVFTRRPGTILTELEINLPRERDLVQLRLDDRYTALTRRLWRPMAPELVEPH